MKTISLFLLLFTLRLSALTPVRFNNQDMFGAPLNNQIVLSAPQAITLGSGAMVGNITRTLTPVNGTITTNLVPGIYNVTIVGVTKGFVLNVIDTTNTLNAYDTVNQLSGMHAFTSTNINVLLEYSTNAVAAGTNAVATTNGAVTTIGVPFDSILTLITNLTANGTNFAKLIGANGTNNDLLFGLNATNFGLLIGANGTNNALAIGLNATNNGLLLGANNTNEALLIGANGTNNTTLAAQNATNYANLVGANATNYANLLSAGQISTQALTFAGNLAGISNLPTARANLGAASLLDATNAANGIAANTTNFATLLSQNGTNEALLIGANGTNESLLIGANATNQVTAASNGLQTAISAKLAANGGNATNTTFYGTEYFYGLVGLPTLADGTASHNLGIGPLGTVLVMNALDPTKNLSDVASTNAALATLGGASKQDATNVAFFVGGNATNLATTLSQNATNEALLIGANGTNNANALGTALTNYANSLSQLPANAVNNNGGVATNLIGYNSLNILPIAGGAPLAQFGPSYNSLWGLRVNGSQTNTDLANTTSDQAAHYDLNGRLRPGLNADLITDGTANHFGLTPAASTNLANVYGTAATNNDLLLGQNGTNYAAALNSTVTALVLAIGANDTNYAKSIGANDTNFVNSTSNSIQTKLNAKIDGTNGTAQDLTVYGTLTPDTVNAMTTIVTPAATISTLNAGQVIANYVKGTFIEAVTTLGKTNQLLGTTTDNSGQAEYKTITGTNGISVTTTTGSMVISNSAPVGVAAGVNALIYTNGGAYTVVITNLPESAIASLIADLASKTSTNQLNAASNVLQTQITADLIAANNLSDVANAGTSRTNLGILSSDNVPLGTTNLYVSRFTTNVTAWASASTTNAFNLIAAPSQTADLMGFKNSSSNKMTWHDNLGFFHGQVVGNTNISVYDGTATTNAWFRVAPNGVLYADAIDANGAYPLKSASVTVFQLNQLLGINTASNIQSQIDGRITTNFSNMSTLPIAKGGTAATTGPAALTNLGALAAANNLSDLGNVSTALTNLGINAVGTLSGDTVALAFANSNKVSDLAARADLVGFVNELKSSGAWTNLVDALVLKPRFGATNRSLLLNPFSTSNLVFSAWGAQFNGTNQIILPVSSQTTNTLVFCFRSPAGGVGTVNGDTFVLGLVNTNTTSASWLYQNVGGGLYEVWERQSSTFPYSGGTGPSYNSLILEKWMSSYDYIEGVNRMGERKVFVITSDGHGLKRVWQDTVQAKINLASPAFDYTSPTVCTDPFNALYVGADIIIAANNFKPWCGEIDCVMVFNCLATQNLINSAYRAARWLEPETNERFWVGDSLLSPDTYGTNSVPAYFQRHQPPLESTWHNYAQGGSKANDFKSYPISAITNLPPQKVTKIDVYYGFGVNDTYGGGDTAANILGNVTNIVANIRTNSNANVFWLPIQQIWTNALAPYAYSSGTEAVGRNVNGVMLTNSLVSGLFRRDLLSSQILLNTNNNFSTDGLHYYGTKGFIAWKAIGDLIAGYPASYGNNTPTNAGPFDNYGNLWLGTP